MHSSAARTHHCLLPCIRPSVPWNPSCLQLRELVPSSAAMKGPDGSDMKRPKHVVLSDTISLLRHLQERVRPQHSRQPLSLHEHQLFQLHPSLQVVCITALLFPTDPPVVDLRRCATMSWSCTS